MKSGRSLLSLTEELERQLGSKKDYLVPSNLLAYRTEDEVSQVHILAGEETFKFGITRHAKRQLAEKLKIPFTYFQRMETEKPQLLDTNVNSWLTGDSERRMVRTLDGKVRAVLSERYRRLDNFDLARHVLPILQHLPQARFESVELTDTKMYLKVVTPAVRYEIVPGDVVQAGVAISNSEVGDGTLSVQPLLYRLVCSNGLIATDRAMHKTHVGRILDSREESVVVFKDDTLDAEDRAFFLKVRDVVESAVSEATFRLIAEKMRKTHDIKLTGDPAKTVQVLANRYDLNEVERSGVLWQLIGQFELSGYGLINAVTGYSKQIADYDRATEFEAIGGQLIELTSSEWRELTEAP